MGRRRVSSVEVAGGSHTSITEYADLDHARGAAIGSASSLSVERYDGADHGPRPLGCRARARRQHDVLGATCGEHRRRRAALDAGKGLVERLLHALLARVQLEEHAVDGRAAAVGPLASSRSVCEPAPPSARAMGCGCSGGADSVEKTASCHSDQLRDSSKAGNSREPRRFTASRVRRLAASSAARSAAATWVGGRRRSRGRRSRGRRSRGRRRSSRGWRRRRTWAAASRRERALWWRGGWRVGRVGSRYSRRRWAGARCCSQTRQRPARSHSSPALRRGNGTSGRGADQSPQTRSTYRGVPRRNSPTSAARRTRQAGTAARATRPEPTSPGGGAASIISSR